HSAAAGAHSGPRYLRDAEPRAHPRRIRRGGRAATRPRSGSASGTFSCRGRGARDGGHGRARVIAGPHGLAHVLVAPAVSALAGHQVTADIPVDLLAGPGDLPDHPQHVANGGMLQALAYYAVRLLIPRQPLDQLCTGLLM